MEVAARTQTRAKAQQPPPAYYQVDKQAQSDDLTAAESRPQRKFPRKSIDTTGNGFTFRKPSLPASATRNVSSSAAVTPVAYDSSQSAMAMRRKLSLKENKAPLGPRPFESPSKRLASDHLASPSRSFLPVSASEPNFDQTGKSQGHDRERNLPNFDQRGKSLVGGYDRERNVPNFDQTGKSNGHDRERNFSVGQTPAHAHAHAHGQGQGQGLSHTNLQYRKPVSRDGSSNFAYGQGHGQGHASAVSLGSFDFLTQVSFDDLQTSIADYDSATSPRLSEFPSPGPAGATIFSEITSSRRSSMASLHKSPVEDRAGFDVPPVPSLRAASITDQQQRQQQQQQQQQHPRRVGNAVVRGTNVTFSPAPATYNPHATPATYNPPAAPRTQDVTLSLRARRQSQAAPANMSTTAASIATGRQPRKSVGPGVLGNMLPGRRNNQAQSDASSTPAAPVNPSRTPSLKSSGRRLTINNIQSSLDTISHAMKPTAASKLKAVQSLPRHSTLPDLSRPDPYQAPTTRATIKPKSTRADSPSSLDKRKSGRISGLGARTISPTDTARARRLSMKPPPLPPSPSKDVSREPANNLSRSPSLIPRLPSVTQSSSRDNPESAYLPQLPSMPLSLSRASSHQSLRAPSTFIGQSASASKLPTPKPRNVYSSADRHDGQEFVPPVPAIPKAYESPKDLLDTTTPFFAGTKTPVTTSLAGSLDSTDSALPRPSAKTRPENPSTPSSDGKMQRRPPNTASMATGDAPQALPPINRRTLQPMRLPPLSLQPLSTPTATRINSYPSSVAIDGEAELTPPRRFFTKTPSTPMTASKATYYRRDNETCQDALDYRSTSSNVAFRGPAFEEPNDGVRLPSPTSTRRGITPFTSGSLPRIGSNFSLNPKHIDEYTLGNHDVEAGAAKPMGPRARATSKSFALAKDSASIKTMSSVEDPEPPTSGNSLRRKLSLGWRRASSKVPSTPTSTDFSTDSPPHHTDMPPPRLPTSATFADFGSAKPPIPDGVRRSMDVTRRKPSIASNLSTATTSDAASTSVTPVAGLPIVNQMRGPAQRASSWSILSGGSRNAANVANKPVPTMPAPAESKSEKDDAIAHDEMRRLSSKRRDVDVAARETDELRKRAVRRDRMTPSRAIQSSAGVLNIFEKGEIVDYKEGVYFCGRTDAKKHVGDISSSNSNNFGYDDERGDYNIVMGDHLAYRYEIIDILGKGSFGQVVRCIDHKHGVLCAIKIIRNKKRFHQQALVEVNILNKLREWDPEGEHATLTITSSFYFRSHLCISSPCLSINLYELIRAHGFAGFSLNIIRTISRQLLTCLVLLQTKRIIHCDLKPENILLCDPRRADVRVIDFGSSCKADEKVYTYIQSRFYRSPEVILGSEYGLGIDMWSVGCILAELYTGYPIFPGENEQEQLACIMEIFGPPSRDIIEKCTRRKLFFDSSLKPRVTVSSKGRRRRPSSKTLGGVLKCDDEAFLDFLAQCLRWDPDKRLRPDQALLHPFINNEPLRRERLRARAPASAQSGANSGRAPSNSPVKRIPMAQSATATSGGAMVSTPVRPRPLPDTPATAMKNNVAMSGSNTSLRNGRRQSLAPPTQAEKHDGTSRLASRGTQHVVTGSKRTSNGTVIPDRHGQHQQQTSSSAGYGAAGIGSTGLPRMVSNKIDLAGAAARESMGVGSKWR